VENHDEANSCSFWWSTIAQVGGLGHWCSRLLCKYAHAYFELLLVLVLTLVVYCINCKNSGSAAIITCMPKLDALAVHLSWTAALSAVGSPWHRP
jgi:hypothetical protein